MKRSCCGCPSCSRPGQSRGLAASSASKLRSGWSRSQRAERPRLRHPRVCRMLRAQKDRRRHVAESCGLPGLHPEPGVVCATGVRPCSESATPEIAAMSAVAKRFPKTRFAIVDVANGDHRSPRERPGCSSARSRSATSPIPGGARGATPSGKGRHQLGGRREAAPVESVHRRVPGRAKWQIRGSHAQRVLAGLHRPGEVQGDRPEPDRSRPVAALTAGAYLAGLTGREQKVWGTEPTPTSPTWAANPDERDEEGRLGPPAILSVGGPVPRRHAVYGSSRRGPGEDQPARAAQRGSGGERGSRPRSSREDPLAGRCASSRSWAGEKVTLSAHRRCQALAGTTEPLRCSDDAFGGR